MAHGDLRSAGRFAAQRAPAGYYLGDPEQGLGDIRRAVMFAAAGGDADAARASTLMYAIGIAHMHDAWPEAMAELRACTTPIDSAHGAVLAALARVDLAVCELALGLPSSQPDALGPACETLAHAAQGSPFDEAGVHALAIVLGVRARPALDPAEIVSTLLEAVDDTHLASTLLRLDILADAFSAHLLSPSPSRPTFAARRGTAAVPFLPGSPLQAEIGHHLPLMVPLDPFRFLLSPPVLEAALDLVADHVGDDHPLHGKLVALTASAPSSG